MTLTGREDVEALDDLQHYMEATSRLRNEVARLEARLAEVERERNEWKETADSRYQTQTRYKLRTMKLANAVRLAHGWFLEEEYVAMADAMDDAMKPTNSVEPHD